MSYLFRLEAHGSSPYCTLNHVTYYMLLRHQRQAKGGEPSPWMCRTEVHNSIVLGSLGFEVPWLYIIYISLSFRSGSGLTIGDGGLGKQAMPAGVSTLHLSALEQQ